MCLANSRCGRLDVATKTREHLGNWRHCSVNGLFFLVVVKRREVEDEGLRADQLVDKNVVSNICA